MTKIRPEDEQRAMLTMLRLLHEGADVRKEKVRRIRELLVAGAYENKLKLQIASDRVVEDLNGTT